MNYSHTGFNMTRIHSKVNEFMCKMIKIVLSKRSKWVNADFLMKLFSPRRETLERYYSLFDGTISSF